MLPNSGIVIHDGREVFDSIHSLRVAHAELMRLVQDHSRPSELAADIRSFLTRAELTGVLIGDSSERETIQNILDYWTGFLFTSPGVDPKYMSSAQLAPFDNSVAPDLSNKPNPYIGLSAFDENSAQWFFGREEASKSLLQKIKEYSIVFVIGPLGSGRTSLLRAGVIPRLRMGLGIDGIRWNVLPIVVPGTNPLTSLLRAAHQSAPNGSVAKSDGWIGEKKSELRRQKKFSSMVDAVERGQPTILVVDQFEELFTLCPDEAERSAFLDAVAEFASGPQSRRKTIIIVRSDMAELVLQSDALKGFADDLGARFSPPAPTAGELRRMIEEPATSVGLRFDAGIVEDLAKEVTGELTALPLLQFTLSQLWAERDRDRVTWNVYTKVGRPRDALRRTVEQVYGSLPAEEKSVAKRLFLMLVVPAEDYGSRRRRVQRSTLVKLDEGEIVTRVLDKFVNAGLVRMTPGLNEEDDRFEVAHEALVSNWHQLEEWLREERQNSERALQYLAMARLARRSGYKGYFLTGDALEEAEKYKAKSELLAEFVEVSKSRAVRRRKWAIRIIVTSALVVAGAGLLYPAVRSWYVKYRTDMSSKDILSTEVSDVSSERKENEIRWLAANGQRLFGVRAVLANLRLENLVAEAPILINATLTNVSFKGGVMKYASFSQAHIEKNAFDDANLEFSRFEDSSISSTSFSRADLYRVDFDRARLNEVDFSGADLRSASFRDVTFEGGETPKFAQATWWLAFGWSADQVERFEKLYSHEAYRSSDRFISEIDNKRAAVKNATGESRAWALNDLAWTLATYGANLEEAESSTSSALEIIGNLSGKTDDNLGAATLKSNLKDTLAYILIQKGGADNFNKAIKLLLEAGATEDGERMFRYAIALYAVGRKDDAERYLTKSINEKKYTPSHELCLLRRYLYGEILETLRRICRT
jgi:hypothetical protein